MTELPDRVRRAFRRSDAFEPASDAGAYRATSTAFDGVVRPEAREDGRTAFAVTVRVPTLDAVTTDDVAPVVEEGWYETFELRVADVGSVARGDHEFDPTVRRADGEAVVEFEFVDVDPDRGVEDARALVDFVEGTYVQGVIPGYEYTEPVSGIIAEARRAAGE
ncbi:MAG: DUF5813 family protein [Haloferacaceae archaeon]